ncbi:MAG: flagellin [Spirochaetales bacterium]|nr:flagellin [Spirochaetales bacterium]
MIINHNMSSINASNGLKFKTVDVDKSMAKLSSGIKINKAGDDASGLAVSEKMRGQIKGLNQAERNVQNGISFIQASEGYLQETQDIVHRIRELAVQASNGIYAEEDRSYIQVEVDQLVDEVNRIASHAQFNGINMLTGAFANPQNENANTTASMWLHVGANMDQREQLFIGDMTAKALFKTEEDGEVSIKDPTAANMTIGRMDEALRVLNSQRADLGAYQNRFEMAQKGIANASENLQAAESLIRDADMAAESVNFVKDSILVQSSTAMLAQANTRPQTVLQLLG